MRSDDAGGQWHEISGDLPTRLRVPRRGARPRARHGLRRADPQRLPALPARRPAARLPLPHRRGRVGGAHRGPAPGALLRRRPARRAGRGPAPLLRPLPRHHRRRRSTPPPTPATPGPRSCATCRPCCRWRCRRCRDPPAEEVHRVRVVLPAPLRTLVGLPAREVVLDVGGASPSAASWTPWRRRTPPCAAPCATAPTGGAARSSASSPAARTSPTRTPTPRCPLRWSRVTSRSSSWGRWRAAEAAVGDRHRPDGCPGALWDNPGMGLSLLLIVVGLVVVVAITAATGYFVAQEFAYMAVDRSRLKAPAEHGDAARRARAGGHRATSFMLSGAQLGITVTGLLVGYVAEPLIGEALGDAARRGRRADRASASAIGACSRCWSATVVQMLFGELFPKNLAIARPEPVALRLARSTLVYLRVFGWLIRFFDRPRGALLRALRHRTRRTTSSTPPPPATSSASSSESRESGDAAAGAAVVAGPDARLPPARRGARDGPALAGGHRRRHRRPRPGPGADGRRALPLPGAGRRDGDVVGVVHLVDLLGRATADPRPPPVTRDRRARRRACRR